MNTHTPTVRQLRLVIAVEDFDQAVAFYRDALGLGELESFQGEDDARVMILNAGIATLEISNPAQVRLIDRVEAEGQPSAKLRVAFEVDDSQQATDTARSGWRPPHREPARDAVAFAQLTARGARGRAGDAVRGARRPAARRGRVGIYNSLYWMT